MYSRNISTYNRHYNYTSLQCRKISHFTFKPANIKPIQPKRQFTFDAVSAIKAIPPGLFDEGYRFVSFDVVSLFTSVPLKRTIDLVLKRVFDEKLITPPARRARRSYKFAPFLFFFSRVESRRTAHG